MSDENVKRFVLQFTFDADRSRFGEKIFACLLVWDEILQQNIVVCPQTISADLNKPGERFVEYIIAGYHEVPEKPQQ